MSLEILLDRSAIEEIVARHGATSEQVARARTKALRMTQASIEKAVRRQAAKDLRMPQRALENRLYTKAIADDDEALEVWIGAYPLSPYRVGAVSAYGVPGKSGGVKAGQRDYPGAFLASVYGIERAWIRLHSKHYSPDLYPTIYRRGDRGMARDHRFPVVRAAVAIDEALAKVVQQQGKGLVSEFLHNFTIELRQQIGMSQ